VNSPNRTKIVATLGPASRGQEMISELIKAGVDVFRINCAHTDHKTMVRDIRMVRRCARALRAMVGVLVDLTGPKIRVGPLRDATPIYLERGQDLLISTAANVVGEAAREGKPARIGCTYAGLSSDVSPRDRILLDDGLIELRVLGVDGDTVRSRVVHGGLLKQYKGINLPGSAVSAESLTAKDLADLQVAVEAGADFIAQSFVREVKDLQLLRRKITEAGSDAHVVAKIERPEAVRALPEIIREADVLMIARGDMGVELGPEAVPALQKKIIRMAVAAQKPVITATQMLESMVINPRPTRAEASDVANAIYDGTSAVMLSGETASGKHPLRAVLIMERIVRRTEADMFSNWEFIRRRNRQKASTVSMATVRAAAYAAVESEARLIAVFTESGATACLLAAERTPTRVVAFTPFQRTVQRLAVVWGVRALRVSHTRTSHEMTLEGERLLVSEGLARPGDRVVIVVGQTRMRGVANIMNIRTLEA
jgi:pyruvate kinase